ncbi:MAG TPA: S8 family serine peptidase, partial [Propionicimonas sp.]
MRRFVVLTSLVAVAALALAAPGAAADPLAGTRDPATTATRDSQDPPPPWVSGDVGDHDAFPEAPDAVTAEQVEPTQVLVRFADRVGVQQQQAALGALAGGADRVRGTHYVTVPTAGEDPAAVVARLKKDPRVADVEVDNVRSATGWTDDPLLSYAWPYYALTRLPRAWDLGQGAGTVIAVVDTGVSATHPELAGSVLPGWDFVDGDADASDGQWHGTAVAATAIGHGDNGVGSAGAAWQASVLPVRVLDSTGNGTDSAVAAGVTYAADQGADVINLSLGGPQPSLVLREALEYAVAHGSLVVVAAGNEGTELPEYPAAYAAEVPGVLSVGATDWYGSLTDFSSWGDSVSLAAPGADIVVPYGTGYVWASGTSFAAPLVSGVAALLVAKGMGPVQVVDALTSSARDAGPRGVDPYYGHGVLDAAAALGLGASIPLDRPAGDGGVDDSPTHAQPLALAATATASISPQGDQDWYSVAVPARGWYTATVTPVPGNGLPAPRASLVALDATGGVLASSGPAGTATGQLLVPVAAAGTVRIGVGDVSGSDAGDTSYQLHLTLAETGVKLRTSGTSTPNNYGDASTAIGDLTGDGVPDVLLDQGATAPLLLAGVGDGTLADPVALPVPPGSSFGWNPSVAILDVDRDGDLDAAVVSAAGLLVTLQGPGG